MSEAAPGPSLPAEELAAADAVRRLAQGLIGRTVDPALSAEVAATVEQLVARVEVEPPRTKAEAFSSYPDHNAHKRFAEDGEWPDRPVEGQPISFDALSFVAGRLSPLSTDEVFRREGDDAVARIRFGPLHEGPPTRVHGGMLAAVFDEAMGAALRVADIPPCFTASLSVRYEAAAPLGVELTFRARVSGVDGRKVYLSGEGIGPDGRFTSAEGLFIKVPLDVIHNVMEDGSASP
ncbi:MAG: PaaI family thioesterase [Actinomycetota bacterium]